MKTKTRVIILLVISAAFAIGVFAMNATARAKPAGPTSLMFVENAGQYDPRVKFQLEGTGGALHITDDALWVTIPEPTGAAVPSGPGLARADTTSRALNLKLSFPQATAPYKISVGTRLDVIRTFLTPAGEFSSVPVWDGLRIADVAPGIDLSLENAGGTLVFNFVRTTGSTPEVQLIIDGATALRLENGLAIAETELGDYAIHLASAAAGLKVILATTDGQTLAVPLNLASGAVSAPTQAGTLIYGSYYGGAGFTEYATTIRADSAGNAYTAGGGPTAPTFNARPGLFVPEHLVKAFIIKLNAAGTAFTYILTISGTDPNGEDIANDIEIDAAGNAYVAGLSSSNDFPATGGSYDPTPNGGYDAWAAKINAAGSSVVFATLLGSSGSEWANGIDLGTFDNLYITGFTNNAAFPTVAGAYDTSHNGGYDVFVSKLSNDGTTLLASTFIGGSGNEGGLLGLDSSDILVDAAGSAYITGPTASGNYPLKSGPFGPGGCNDVFLSKFNPDLDTLYLSTKLGGSGNSCGSDGDDNGQRLDLDASGNIYLTGFTTTANGKGFPVTAGAFQTSYGGTYDGFLLKLNPIATSLLYGTYIGGSSVDVGNDVVVDAKGIVYLVGYTFSSNYPVTATAYDSTLGGGIDAVITKLGPFGSGATDLLYSTYFGGDGTDGGYGISVLGMDVVFLAGYAGSDETTFPITIGSADDTYSGDQDAFFSRFHLLSPATPAPVPTWTPAPIYLSLPITINE